MSEEKDFQQRVQRIGALVGEIEQIADPAVRASTIQLVQLVMEFHGTGLDRALEILARSGEAGIEMIEELGRDPMVSSLLVLYGLHPDNLGDARDQSGGASRAEAAQGWRPDSITRHQPGGSGTGAYHPR